MLLPQPETYRAPWQEMVRGLSAWQEMLQRHCTAWQEMLLPQAESYCAAWQEMVRGLSKLECALASGKYKGSEHGCRGTCVR